MSLSYKQKPSFGRARRGSGGAGGAGELRAGELGELGELGVGELGERERGSLNDARRSGGARKVSERTVLNNS